MKAILIPICLFAFSPSFAQVDSTRTVKSSAEVKIVEEEKLIVDTVADKTIRRSNTEIKEPAKLKIKNKIKKTSSNTNQKKSEVKDPTPPRH